MKRTVPLMTLLTAANLACGGPLEQEEEATPTQLDSSLIANTIVGDWFYCADAECTTFIEEAYRFTPEGEIYRLASGYSKNPSRYSSYRVGLHVGRYKEPGPGELEVSTWLAPDAQRQVWRLDGQTATDPEGYLAFRRKGYRTGEASGLWGNNTCGLISRIVESVPGCPAEVKESVSTLDEFSECGLTFPLCLQRLAANLCGGENDELLRCIETESHGNTDFSELVRRPEPALPFSHQPNANLVPATLPLVGAWAECEDRDCHRLGNGRVRGISFGRDGFVYKLEEEDGVVFARPEKKERYYVVSEDDHTYVLLESRNDVEVSVYQVSVNPTSGYTVALFANGALYRQIELGKQSSVPEGK